MSFLPFLVLLSKLIYILLSLLLTALLLLYLVGRSSASRTSQLHQKPLSPRRPSLHNGGAHFHPNHPPTPHYNHRSPTALTPPIALPPRRLSFSATTTPGSHPHPQPLARRPPRRVTFNLTPSQESNERRAVSRNPRTAPYRSPGPEVGAYVAAASPVGADSVGENSDAFAPPGAAAKLVELYPPHRHDVSTVGAASRAQAVSPPSPPPASRGRYEGTGGWSERFRSDPGEDKEVVCVEERKKTPRKERVGGALGGNGTGLADQAEGGKVQEAEEQSHDWRVARAERLSRLAAEARREVERERDSRSGGRTSSRTVADNASSKEADALGASAELSKPVRAPGTYGNGNQNTSLDRGGRVEANGTVYGNSGPRPPWGQSKDHLGGMRAVSRYEKKALGIGGGFGGGNVGKTIGSSGMGASGVRVGHELQSEDDMLPPSIIPLTEGDCGALPSKSGSNGGKKVRFSLEGNEVCTIPTNSNDGFSRAPPPSAFRNVPSIGSNGF